jgi:hypothetical protein
MVKKSEKIEQILKEIQLYCEQEKFPWLGQLLGIKENYKIEHIIGMVEKFIVGPYNEGVLDEYLKVELAKYKMMQALMCQDLPEVDLSDEQLKYVKCKLIEIIKVITF